MLLTKRLIYFNMLAMNLKEIATQLSLTAKQVAPCDDIANFDKWLHNTPDAFNTQTMVVKADANGNPYGFEYTIELNKNGEYAKSLLKWHLAKMSSVGVIDATPEIIIINDDKVVQDAVGYAYQYGDILPDGTVCQNAQPVIVSQDEPPENLEWGDILDDDE